MNKKIYNIFIIIILILIVIFVLFRIIRIQDQVMKLVYKIDYEEYINKYSTEYGVDSYLVYALIKAESNFKTEAVSHKEAKGLMQLMPDTAKELAQKENIEITDLLEPETNVRLGTKYLSELLKHYNQNYLLAITAYNAGMGTVDKWIKDGIIQADGSDIENIPYKETNNYVRKIQRDYKIYQELYGNQ